MADENEIKKKNKRKHDFLWSGIKNICFVVTTGIFRKWRQKFRNFEPNLKLF